MAVEKHKMMRTQKYPVARSLLTFMVALGIQRCAASTPVLLPSVKQAQITLNGLWKMTLNPPVDFWQNSVKATDPSRPVIASYQIVMDVKGETYNIKSHHYPKWDSDFAAVPMPTLYDLLNLNRYRLQRPSPRVMCLVWRVGDWWMNGGERNQSTVVTIKGLHDTIEANYVFTIYGNGQCDIHYTFSNIPRLQLNHSLDKNGFFTVCRKC